MTIKFVDFSPGFNRKDNKLIQALRTRHDVTVLDSKSAEVPDLLFYSYFGAEHLRYNCLKIYFTGENDVPDFNECDYAVSHYSYDVGGRNLRYPHFMLYEMEEALNRKPLSEDEALNRGFCTCVQRNFQTCHPMRIKIIDAVDKFKPLAYGGPWRNNVGAPVEDKIKFISDYKFNLALENSILPGYVTEKILEPLAARTVPIYWGDKQALQDFNPEAFIYANDFPNMESLISEIQRIDNDKDAYMHMVNAPVLRPGQEMNFDEQLADFLCRIASNPIRQVSPYAAQGALHRRKRILYPLAFNRYAMKLINVLFSKKELQ